SSQIESALRELDGLGLLALLAVDPFERDQLIDDIVHGGKDGRVVALDRGVITGLVQREVPTQPSALEQRQRDGGANAQHAAAGGEQSTEPKMLQADER